MPTTEVSMSTIVEEMVLAHFIVSDDVERSRRFYTEVLGGKTVISSELNDEVTYVALANSWIISRRRARVCTWQSNPSGRHFSSCSRERISRISCDGWPGASRAWVRMQKSST
jgi:hypothetical protein